MNRFAKTILVAAGLMSLAGCSKGNDTADAVRNETDATADALDNRADVLEDQGLENQADALENRADAVREAGENQADAIEDGNSAAAKTPPAH